MKYSITDPSNNNKSSIFNKNGTNILKKYIKFYSKKGGMVSQEQINIIEQNFNLLTTNCDQLIFEHTCFKESLEITFNSSKPVGIFTPEQFQIFRVDHDNSLRKSHSIRTKIEIFRMEYNMAKQHLTPNMLLQVQGIFNKIRDEIAKSRQFIVKGQDNLSIIRTKVNYAIIEAFKMVREKTIAEEKSTIANQLNVIVQKTQREGRAASRSFSPEIRTMAETKLIVAGELHVLVQKTLRDGTTIEKSVAKAEKEFRARAEALAARAKAETLAARAKAGTLAARERAERLARARAEKARAERLAREREERLARAERLPGAKAPAPDELNIGLL